MIQDVEKVLKKWGFKVKEWVISGERELSPPHLSIVGTEEEKVLDIHWNPLQDFSTSKYI